MHESDLSNPADRPIENEHLLDLLRCWVFETEEAILQSRELLRSTRAAIEILERLQTRQPSN
jgi:hypothetical protein